MSSITSIQNSHIKPLQPTVSSVEQRVAEAKEVRDVFRTFVGESFFGQMLKSMRQTQGKPAYFHGGRAEEVFQGQLDQNLATKMTDASADQIADPMFRQQFPQQAALLAEHEKAPASLDDLSRLRRQ